MDTAVLAIGTRKGLWLATSSDRLDWELSQPHFLMHQVPSVAVDTRGGRTRLLVGVRSQHWGPTVLHSDDLGATWSEPEQRSLRFDEDDGAALERIWQVQPDSADRPGVVWAGCEPISVRRSTDHGEHFDLVRGLWDHPHRGEWGAGYGGPAAHTVLPSPVDGTLHVAMSTGGLYRSMDDGSTWQPRNRGISAYLHARTGAGTRPVRAQGRPGRRRPAPALCAEPPRRVPQRRRRGQLDVDRRGAAERLRLRHADPPAAGGHAVGVAPGSRTASASRPAASSPCTAAPTPAVRGRR